jgi:ABC-type iron transport system FetAB permease component
MQKNNALNEVDHNKQLIKGILFMLLFSVAVVILAFSVHFASRSFSSFQIIFFRGVVGLSFNLFRLKYDNYNNNNNNNNDKDTMTIYLGKKDKRKELFWRGIIGYCKQKIIIYFNIVN